MEDKTLAVRDTDTLQVHQADKLLAEAVKKGLPVETMERLIALRERIKAEAAREAFYLAMSQFKSLCPRISKTKVVRNTNGSVRYKYAAIDDISAAIDVHLNNLGLSYSFDMAFEDRSGKDYEIATCVVKHVAGHSERSAFKVPVEFGNGMNAVQAFGSASTYARRYALCNAFGLTPDEDDDAIITATVTQEKKAPEKKASKFGIPGCISEAQATRLFAIASKGGRREKYEIKAMLENVGLHSTSEISAGMYGSWVLWAERGMTSDDLWKLYQDQKEKTTEDGNATIDENTDIDHDLGF